MILSCWQFFPRAWQLYGGSEVKKRQTPSDRNAYLDSLQLTGAHWLFARTRWEAPVLTGTHWSTREIIRIH